MCEVRVVMRRAFLPRTIFSVGWMSAENPEGLTRLVASMTSNWDTPSRPRRGAAIRAATPETGVSAAYHQAVRTAWVFFSVRRLP